MCREIVKEVLVSDTCIDVGYDMASLEKYSCYKG